MDLMIPAHIPAPRRTLAEHTIDVLSLAAITEALDARLWRYGDDMANAVALRHFDGDTRWHGVEVAGTALRAWMSARRAARIEQDDLREAKHRARLTFKRVAR